MKKFRRGTAGAEHFLTVMQIENYDVAALGELKKDLKLPCSEILKMNENTLIGKKIRCYKKGSS